MNRQPEVRSGFPGAIATIQWRKAWNGFCDPANDGMRSASFISASSILRPGLCVGGVGLNELKPEHRLANLGYWVRTAWTGRGVATAAASLAAEFGFEELLLDRIEILAALGNKPSQQVAQKLGAHKEGILRNRLVIHGRAHDAVVFSLIGSERRTRDKLVIRETEPAGQYSASLQGGTEHKDEDDESGTDCLEG